jgi:hypothetical protein
MLTLKDLSASKELDRKALTEVRGGSVFNTALQSGGSSAVAGGVAVATNNQTQNIFNFDNDFDWKESYAFIIGGVGSGAIAL